MIALKRKVVRAYIHDIDDENVLLIKSYISRKHSLPGGGVEKNESLEDALLRELSEELGISRNSVKRLEQKSTILSKKRLFLIPLVSEISFFDVYLKKNIVLKHSIEVRVAKWFSLSEYSNHLSEYEAYPF